MGRFAQFSAAAGVMALVLSYACCAQSMRHEGMAGSMMSDSTPGRSTMTGKGRMDSTGMGMMDMRGKNAMDKTGMMGNDDMNGMGMMGMMSMMTPSKVIVVDNGYLVQVCNMLIIYDKDLNKKKEVVVTLDSMAMKSMMQQMGAMKKMHLEHMKAMHDMPMGTTKEMPMQEKAKEKRK